VEFPADVDGTVLDPKMAGSGGIIDLPFPVLSWEERVLLFGDAEPRVIDPRKYEPQCTEVLVPYMPAFDIATGHQLLDMVTYRADNLVRAVQTGDPLIVQRSVTKYHDELLSKLAGKDGLISRHVLSVRCSNSLRFVVVSGSELQPDEVGLPDRAAKQAGIQDGDVVIISRAPVLWQGSVLVMRAHLIPAASGRLNPWCLKDLGADYDGDTVSCFKWPAGVAEPDTLGPEHPVLPLEVEQAAAWTGLTLGPKDVLNPAESAFIKAYAEVKSPPPDLQRYAHGLGMEEFLADAQDTALDMHRIKTQLGLVGSITDKICALMPEEHLGAALRAKEKVTQALFDSKHGTASLDARDLLHQFESGTQGDMQACLEDAGVPAQDACNIVEACVLAGAPPLSRAFQENSPMLAVSKGAADRVTALKALELLLEAPDGPQ